MWMDCAGHLDHQNKALDDRIEGAEIVKCLHCRDSGVLILPCFEQGVSSYVPFDFIRCDCRASDRLSGVPEWVRDELYMIGERA